MIAVVSLRLLHLLFQQVLALILLRSRATSIKDVELRDRPRAVSVRWGHERLVGCRALEPCH